MTKRRFTLLEAYERFTEKETLCIRESNFEEVRSLQEKKGKLIRELGILEDAELIEDNERQDFDRRLVELGRIEEANGQLLDKMQRQNRSNARSLAKQVSPVARIQKAYGGSDRPAVQRGLEGKA